MNCWKKNIGKEALKANVRNIREKTIECFDVICPLCKTENYEEIEKNNCIEKYYIECVCCGKILEFTR